MVWNNVQKLPPQRKYVYYLHHECESTVCDSFSFYLLSLFHSISLYLLSLFHSISLFDVPFGSIPFLQQRNGLGSGREFKSSAVKKTNSATGALNIMSLFHNSIPPTWFYSGYSILSFPGSTRTQRSRRPVC